MSLVDFHCHLDLYPDFDAAVEAADKSGVYTLAVTTTPKAWPRNRDLTKHTKRVRAALGLHPQLVSERFDELDLWDSYLHETRYVGEVGLDAGPRFYRSFELQKKVFEHVLRRCADAGSKVLTVHSVRATAQVLDMVEAYLPQARGQVVLHWFTGTKAEARRAIMLGCYFSINAEMLKTDKGRTLVQSLPHDRLLTETDGPFTMIDGRPTQPDDVRSVLRLMADVRQVSVERLSHDLHGNLKELLRT